MHTHSITPGMVARTCEACGKTFHVYPSALKNSPCRFCSFTCRDAGKHPETRPCALCGAAFRAYQCEIRKGGGVYCSQKCRLQVLSERPRLPLEIRFWQKVAKTETCWLWTGSTSQDGYGQMSDKLPDGRATTKRANRFSWEIHVGPVPDGMHVLHNCPGGDNPACVNPAHLWLGTDADNNADCIAKDRRPCGERSITAKLTRIAVLDIRARYIPGVVTRRMLAEEYGVSPSTIQHILENRTWRHLLP